MDQSLYYDIWQRDYTIPSDNPMSLWSSMPQMLHKPATCQTQVSTINSSICYSDVTAKSGPEWPLKGVNSIIGRRLKDRVGVCIS